ncbi:hydrolase [Streptococcus sp. X16XC17]|uniref:hydrolase n=1 Tax=unclassified Streptococcus TaxID=2608887 RepID=UPI00066FC4D5|nr:MULTISPECIES: hydrolase [unclassified Streptococcus]TCD45920.1 hydrolase [Streptococcus sp. X16XC17]
MSSETIRNQVEDHLLTPQNEAFIAIDYRPIQVQSIKSMDSDELVHNIIKTAKIAKLYDLPTILSTVNVSTGANKPQIDELTQVFPDIEPIDRTTINSWEDTDFKEAVEATGRKKLVMTALWTEACLSFPALDAVKEGYEVYAVGGTSKVAHETALRRMEQAGVKLISWVQLACELQRDWNRTDTAEEFATILFKD